MGLKGGKFFGGKTGKFFPKTGKYKKGGKKFYFRQIFYIAYRKRNVFISGEIVKASN